MTRLLLAPLPVPRRTAPLWQTRQFMCFFPRFFIAMCPHRGSRASVVFPHEVDPLLKDILLGLLEKDPQRRLTAEQIRVSKRDTQSRPAAHPLSNTPTHRRAYP